MEPFLQALLDKAMRNRRSNVIANARLKELYALFIKQTEVPDRLLEDMNIMRPSPDKTLRIKRIHLGESALIPADAAMAIVLRFALTQPPTLLELKELLRSNPPPTASS